MSLIRQSKIMRALFQLPIHSFANTNILIILSPDYVRFLNVSRADAALIWLYELVSVSLDLNECHLQRLEESVDHPRLQLLKLFCSTDHRCQGQDSYLLFCFLVQQFSSHICSAWTESCQLVIWSPGMHELIQYFYLCVINQFNISTCLDLQLQILHNHYHMLSYVVAYHFHDSTLIRFVLVALVIQTFVSRHAFIVVAISAASSSILSIRFCILANDIHSPNLHTLQCQERWGWSCQSQQTHHMGFLLAQRWPKGPAMLILHRPGYTAMFAMHSFIFLLQFFID